MTTTMPTGTSAVAPLNEPLPAPGSDTLLDSAMAAPFDVDGALDRLKRLKDFFGRAMELGQGKDYGPPFPGATEHQLYTAGADKFCQFIGVYPRPREIHRTEQWGLTAGERAFFAFEYQVDIVSRRTGQIVAVGVGSANSLEGRYRYRRVERTCPQCASEAVIKGQEKYGGGWLCFKKKGGCGAKFADGDAAIEAQEVGRIENPDLAELHHTINRMALKRGKVHGVAQLVSAIGILMQPADDDGADDDDHGRRAAPSSKGGPADASTISDEQAAQIEKAATANGHTVEALMGWVKRDLKFDAAQSRLPRSLYVQVLKRASSKDPLPGVDAGHDGDPFAGKGAGA